MLIASHAPVPTLEASGAIFTGHSALSGFSLDEACTKAPDGKMNHESVDGASSRSLSELSEEEDEDAEVELPDEEGTAF